MAFKLGAIHHQDDGGILEARLVLKNQACCGKQGEGLSGALCVPDEPALLGLVLASLDDLVDGNALVLAQDGFPRLAVLDIEQDPVAKRAKEIGGLEECLHRELVGLLGLLLPARHVATIGVPSHTIPVVEQMRDVEKLRRADQLGRLLLIALELRHAPIDGAAVLGVLVLDDADGNAIDDEHHVRPVAFARRRLQLPFPRDVKDVLAQTLEIDELNVAVALFALVVPLPLAA